MYFTYYTIVNGHVVEWTAVACKISERVSLWAADNDADKAAVIKAIEDAYLNGMNNIGDPKAMKKGFYEDFSLKGIIDGKLVVLTISENKIENVG